MAFWKNTSPLPLHFYSFQMLWEGLNHFQERAHDISLADERNTQNVHKREMAIVLGGARDLNQPIKNDFWMY